ncbi:TetR/AcrR family transcriptional regulator [Clostridium sediminicola]|uniref:TetR/AcrR family transcriptional regulator n=1 Tax=Clostridium sediminicola TaxID=3114879 RepID=UPI0031F24A5D
MQEIFKNIDPEKKDRIINSSLEEFSKNSYEKASTNNIVRNAGISKGLLYHYFKSKKSLYEHLEIFAIQTMASAILEELDWDEPDIFARIKQVITIKFKVILRYPSLVDFSKVIYDGKSMDEIKKTFETYIPNVYNKIYYQNIDFMLFKENVDVQKAIKMTQWTLEKLGEEWITKSESLNVNIDYEAFTQEIDEYLKMLKEAFYR